MAKVDRKGVLPEQIYLDYSQERLAQYGMKPSNLKDILEARNSTIPGGALEVPKSIQIDPSGKFENAQQIGDVIIGVSNLRPTARSIFGTWWIFSRLSESARYLNYLTWKDNDDRWHRSRAVTVAVQMKDGQQIEKLGKRGRKVGRSSTISADDLVL